jgi:hypothetical protein
MLCSFWLGLSLACSSAEGYQLLILWSDTVVFCLYLIHSLGMYVFVVLQLTLYELYD